MRAAWMCIVGVVIAVAPLRTDAIPPAPLCEPVLSCGCFIGCDVYQRVGESATDPRYRLVGGSDKVYKRANAPYTPVCDAKGHCTPPLINLREACDKTCAERPEAPFVCEMSANQCERRPAAVEPAPK